MYKSTELLLFVQNVIGIDEYFETIQCNCGKVGDLILSGLGLGLANSWNECDCEIKSRYRCTHCIEGSKFEFIKNHLGYYCSIKNKSVIEVFTYKKQIIPDWVPKIRIPDNKVIGELSKGIISEVILKFDREYGKELMKYLK